MLLAHTSRAQSAIVSVAQRLIHEASATANPPKKAAMSRLECGAWRAAGINPLPDYLGSFLWL